MSRVKRMGEVYSAGDVVVTVAGMFDVNPSVIEYNTTNAHEYSRGIARKARGWRMGGEEHDGKITLTLDVVSHIERAAPKGRLANIRPFPINVTYFNQDNEMIHDVITAKFKGQGRSVTADGELEKEFDLFVLDIKYNIA
ncbi:MAG: hypothetical protein A2066_18885 [Bacteroidetes bacterium GWB2_41_8]|nr:MAG: hypothetical protein A2066_18885 [Bacteroidetes bacterium GWB2_41_8]